MNKQERLQAAWDASGQLATGLILFRSPLGWWYRPDYPLHFGDEGMCIGMDYEQAMAEIASLTGRRYVPPRKRPVRRIGAVPSVTLFEAAGVSF